MSCADAGDSRPDTVYRAIELHDSQLIGFVRVGAQVIVFLRAYLHQSEGAPGVDRGTGWVQAAALRWAEARVVGAAGELPADIWDGSLIVGDEAMPNTVPVPFAYEGPVVLRLVLADGAEAAIDGTDASLVLIGEPEFVEEFAGA